MLKSNSQEEPPEESLKFCQAIFSEILENIFTTYETIEHQFQKNSKIPKSPLNMQHKPIFLSDFAESYKLPILQTLHFTEKSPSSYQLRHLEVHKQHVFNLCGYHTLFNLIEICKLIKSQDLSVNPKSIFNPAR